ncbi:hypothetical protein CWE12_07325 [Aliidiomarina sedimenti]|uniref:Phage shock protein B n=2 Tax=Aliidiomarina TaxID=1249554 RepID=A0A432WC31_9GAMM|nr:MULTISPECIES: hypothetical protein [Aliidiomarina]RUO29613.1 hypothetical protein CWE14_14235 [Aliidiomarina soli]RUO29775.1 hypothetical protein CWE12_07325 [Aliidiomarina sedimenti]
MGPFEIAAIAIIGGCAIEIYRTYVKRQNAKQSKTDPALREEVEALKERVATLEALVTDKSYQLREEFKRL